MKSLVLPGMVLSVAGCIRPFAPDDLSVDWGAVPAVVQAGDSMVARLVITNTSSDTVTLTSGSSCVATPAVLSNGEHVAMQGTALGCLTVVSYFPIAPHDSLIRSFRLVAMLQEQESPWRYSEPPPPGVYQLRALMQVELADEYAEFRVVQ